MDGRGRLARWAPSGPASPRVVVVGIAALAVIAGLFAPLEPDLKEATTRAQSSERPNVVVVLSDDQDIRMLRVMENVKSHLRGQGATFLSHHATFPLCCPARATFLTGQYSHNHGVRDNVSPAGGYGKFRQRGSLPIAMRRSGYRTGWIGKFLNGYGMRSRGGDPREVPRGWDTWVAPVNGPHKMYDYTLNEDGAQRRYGSKPRDYQTDVFAEKAAGFIRESAPAAQPFFLTVAPLAPHTEDGPDRRADPRPAPRHRDALRGMRYWKSPSFNERNVSDKPSFVRNTRRKSRAERRDLRRAYFDRHRSLLAVDDAVGRLVNELDRAGELDNTLIVYTSDNGYMLGEHRLKGKTDLYEESVKVPLIMRGPGVPAGVRRKQLTGDVDLAPTILDIADAAPLLRMDGRSLLPLVANPRVARNRMMLLENQRSSAIRTRRYMYAEHPKRERELYDMRRDPYQLRSRHSSRKLAPVRRKLARKLARVEDCAGARCP